MLISAAVLAGCEDTPTAPQAYVQPAEGQMWIAITVPPAVPDLDAWLPYLRDGEHGTRTVERVRALQKQAEHARRVGELEHALELDEQAIRLAASSLVTSPERRLLHRSFAALDLWLERAEIERSHAVLPELDSAVEEVRAARKAAESALNSGDPAAAMLHLGMAALRVREQSPSAVALRVLQRVSERLENAALSDVDAARARRLLANAREALVARQDARALQRALYALQVADGQVAPTEEVVTGERCRAMEHNCPDP